MRQLNIRNESNKDEKDIRLFEELIKLLLLKENELPSETVSVYIKPILSLTRQYGGRGISSLIGLRQLKMSEQDLSTIIWAIRQRMLKAIDEQKTRTKK